VITAKQEGRNLSITVDGIDEPFIIQPLPGFAGEKATEMFILIAAREMPPEKLAEVWQLALDGVNENGDTIVDGPNWTRIKRTLSLTEGESVIHPAFYWQTTLGIDGVNEFIEAGGGLPGAKKVLERLILTLGISPMQTGRSGALENLMQQALFPPTNPSTTALDKLPPNKRGFRQSGKRKQRRD
jgi:hypothetical protein